MQPPYMGGSPPPAPSPPAPAAVPPPSARRGTWLSAVAVALATVAVVLSVVVPGPSGASGVDGAAGPEGPPGDPGAQGPGATVASSTSVVVTTVIGGTCSSYTEAAVTFAASGPGTAIITGQVHVHIEHVAGTEDFLQVHIGTTSTDCGPDVWGTQANVLSSQPTGLYVLTISVQEPRAIPSAGTYTFYLNAFMSQGASAGDLFWGGGLIAVFYPA